MNMNKEYIILDENKHPAHKFINGGKSWNEVKDFDNIAMIVPEPFIVLDFDTESDAKIMLEIVESKDLHCKVMKTDRGYHFWFRSLETLNNFTKARLAVGIWCDRKVCKKHAYVVIKRYGKMREWLRDYEDEDVDYLPAWLKPLKTPESMFQFKGMKSGDGRNQQLFNYVVYMQDHHFKKDDILQTLEIINQYVFAESLPASEFKSIVREEAFKSEEQIEQEAKEKKTKKEKSEASGEDFKFHHEEFANQLIEDFNIIAYNRNLYIYKDGYYQPNENDIEMAMITMFPAIKDAQRQEVLKYIKIVADVHREIEGNKPNPYIININNGRLNLLTGELSEHSKDCYDFSRIPVSYNSAAECRILDDTLELIFKDADVLELIEEMIGVCLMADTSIYQKCFLLYGNGANGKSTFFYLLKKFLGDKNVSAIEMDKLGNRFMTSELEHKLANIGDDLNYTNIKNNGTIKKLISGDAIQVERKNEQPYSFVSYATQIFATNELPRSSDKTDGMMRRLCFVPCLAKFGAGGHKKNPLIKFDITTDEALSHLLNRAMKGIKRLKKNGDFTVPDAIIKAKEKYMIDNSTVLSWVEDEEISIETVLENSSINLYNFFCNWCERCHIKETTGKKTFNKEMIAKFNLSPVQKKRRTDNGFARFFVTNLGD